MGPRSEKTVMQRAVGYLSRREYAPLELKKKLRQVCGPEVPESEIDLVVKKLIELGYLSEERYARAVVNSRGERYGNTAIALRLSRAGVSREIIGEVLRERDESGSERDRLRSVWERKFGSAPDNHKEKARQVRFLASRGFPLSMILSVVPPIRHSSDVEES